MSSARVGLTPHFRSEFGLAPKDYQQKMSKNTVDIEKELREKDAGGFKI